METFHSHWIKSRLIFHHWITNLIVECLYKYMGEIWAIGSNFKSFKKWAKKIIDLSQFWLMIYCWFFQKISDFSAIFWNPLPVAPRIVPLAILSLIYWVKTDISSILQWFSRNRFRAVRYPIHRQNIANKNWFFNPCIRHA